MANVVKRILVNQSNGQLRVARTEGSSLYDLEIEASDRHQKVDDIWNGEVVSVEPSLDAAFVNFGANRNGFLPRKEIAPEYCMEAMRNKGGGRINIQDILFKGQKLLVQVIKEERGTKGAALSTFMTLAGCYLVLMPNNPKATGISKRIEGEERDDLKKILDSLVVPPGMGVIVRTAGIGRSLEELQWDLNVLVQLWEAIKTGAQSHGAPHLIHQESDAAIRVVRDHLHPDISEILIDDKDVYTKVRQYIEKARPAFIEKVKFYDQEMPLFSRFQIEHQIESIFQRRVRLPSGGEIVIDHTEALTAIDVNSAQSTKGDQIETTALNTNLEAAYEIAKQLRLRDLGGLFVIDFIDMEQEDNNRKVEEAIKDSLKADRARTQLTRLSRFGLLEMSRQRLRPALYEFSQNVCPRCHGQGSIRNVPSQATGVLRLIEEAASKESTSQVRVQVPVDVATYLLNEKREALEKIETINAVSVIVIPNPYIETPEYKLDVISGVPHNEEGKRKPISYEMLTAPAVDYKPTDAATAKPKPSLEPAVKDQLLIAAPVVKHQSGFMKWLKKLFQGETVATAQKREERREGPKEQPYRHGRGDRRPSSMRNRRSSSRRGDRPYGQKPPFRGDRPDRTERQDRQGQPERSERPDRRDRPERRERPEKVQRTETPQAIQQVTIPAATAPKVEKPMTVEQPKIEIPKEVQKPERPKVQEKPVIILPAVKPMPVDPSMVQIETRPIKTDEKK